MPEKVIILANCQEAETKNDNMQFLKHIHAARRVVATISYLSWRDNSSLLGIIYHTITYPEFKNRRHLEDTNCNCLV